MGYYRRVTLRCICEDLVTDWSDVAEQRGFAHLREVIASDAADSDIALAAEALPTTARASHPLVASFFASFATDDESVRRESISGLSDPHWWKQKVARWRGAATDADVVGSGEAWLCAGGLRAGGEARDFYARFMDEIAGSGPEAYLPGTDDRRLQSVEEKVARRDAWLDQVRLSVLVCVAAASAGSGPIPLHVPAPAPAAVESPLLHLTVELDRIEDSDGELVELVMTVRDTDHARAMLVEIALEAARSVIEPVEEAWRVLPGAGTDQVWSSLVSSEMLETATQTAAHGAIPERLRGSSMLLGVRAHYTPKDHIVSASVEGDAIRGLCGTWFVPTANPEGLPVCPACQHVHLGLS